MTESIGGSKLKIRRLLQGFMMVALLGAGVPVLHAQDYRVFIEGGVSTLHDKHYYNVYGVSLGSTYRTGNNFTVGAEYPIFKTLSAEGSYSMFRNNLAVTNFINSTTPNDVIGYGIRGQRISIDANAHSGTTIKGVRPYLVFGLDLNRFSPTSGGAALAQSPGFNGVPDTVLKSDDSLGYNFGFGLDISLTHILAVRLDARDHRFGSPTYGLPDAASSAFTAYYPIGGTANNLVYSAGIVIHFGK
jgi:opacity protein-like surface antigen